MLIEPIGVWGDPDVWIPVSGVIGGFAVFAGIALLMILFIFFVSKDSTSYHPVAFPKRTVISLLFVAPALGLSSFLLSVQGGTKGDDVYAQFSQASETTYGFPVSRDAIDLLLEGNSPSVLADGGPEGVRQTLGSATLVLPDGDVNVTLSWAGNEWVFLTDDHDNATEIERTN